MRSKWIFKAVIYYCTISMVFMACKQKPDTIDTIATGSEDTKISTDIIANPTEITFARDLHDFGEIIQGEVVKTEFKFQNTGDHDLIISDAYGSCGCTTPDWPKEPLKPGESGVIKVGFNSDKRSGPFNKTVTVVANTAPGAPAKLHIKGVIIVPEEK